MSTLGERLRKARNRLGLSQGDVIEKLKKRGVDIKKAYLSHLERGRRENPDLKLLKELAKIYDVNISYFVAPEETIEALSPEEREYFEEMLQNNQIKAFLREARGLTSNDLARIIQIAKAWNEGKIEKGGIHHE